MFSSHLMLVNLLHDCSWIFSNCPLNLDCLFLYAVKLLWISICLLFLTWKTLLFPLTSFLTSIVLQNLSTTHIQVSPLLLHSLFKLLFISFPWGSNRNAPSRWTVEVGIAKIPFHPLYTWFLILKVCYCGNFEIEQKVCCLNFLEGSKTILQEEVNLS